MKEFLQDENKSFHIKKHNNYIKKNKRKCQNCLSKTIFQKNHKKTYYCQYYGKIIDDININCEHFR